MPFRVKRTIQTTVELIVDHEEDAVAVAMEPIGAFVGQATASGSGIGSLTKWKERGTPSITPTAPKEP